MINNDIFRRLRYAINASDNEIIKICSLKKFPVTYDDIKSFESKEDDENFKEMSDMALQFFLDGLIIKRRGENPAEIPASQSTIVALSNNMILKKIRIAFEFQEEDMLAIFKLTEFDLSKSELSALFRKKGQTNYKELGDQGLRNFLKGLTVKLRGK